MKVLYEQMPVIYIYAINTTAGKDPKLYECPIYRKPQRTDLKYVGSIDFETDFNPKHWTLRGVALLCDIKWTVGVGDAGILYILLHTLLHMNVYVCRSISLWIIKFISI